MYDPVPARPSDSGPPDPPKFAEPEREHVRAAIQWAARRVLAEGTGKARAHDRTGMVPLVATYMEEDARFGFGEDECSPDPDDLRADMAALLLALPVENWPGPKPRPSPYWEFAQGMARGMAELNKGGGL